MKLAATGSLDCISLCSIPLGMTALFLLVASASAQDAKDEPSAPSSNVKVSYEAKASYSYVGKASTELGDGRTGDLSEEAAFAHFVVTPQWDDGPLYRFGLEYQRYSFGLPRLAPVPNTLQSVAVIVGADAQFFDSWLVRVEAQPGIYSDFHDVTIGDFNVPFLIGGSYIASAKLQWVAGLSVDVNREWPVIPAVGVRWAFMDKWVLNAILPTPRLEFEWSKSLTLFGGASVSGATYRVDGEFGDAHGKPRLNNAIVEYSEIRAGAGLSWKASPDVSFEIEAGYLPYRSFNFHRAGEEFQNDSGAPYGQAAVSAKF